MQNNIILGLILSVFIATTANAQIVKKNIAKSSQLTSNVASIGPKDKSTLSSASSSRKDKLKKMEAEFQARYIARKEEALAYAFIHNVPVRKTLENGSFAELQYIADDGSLIYYRTYNSAAATSTRADWLHTGGGMGLNLNGNGLIAHVGMEVMLE